MGGVGHVALERRGQRRGAFGRAVEEDWLFAFEAHMSHHDGLRVGRGALYFDQALDIIIHWMLPLRNAADDMSPEGFALCRVVNLHPARWHGQSKGEIGEPEVLEVLDGIQTVSACHVNGISDWTRGRRDIDRQNLRGRRVEGGGSRAEGRGRRVADEL